MELNFDGSSMGNPGPTGFGCIVRDDFSNIVLVLSGPLGWCDCTKAEMLGLLEELCGLKCLGIQCWLLEGDSKVVVSLALGKCDGSWKMAHFVWEIKSLTLDLEVSL